MDPFQNFIIARAHETSTMVLVLTPFPLQRLETWIFIFIIFSLDKGYSSCEKTYSFKTTHIEELVLIKTLKDYYSKARAQDSDFIWSLSRTG
jgi:hypothetical protein